MEDTRNPIEKLLGVSPKEANEKTAPIPVCETAEDMLEKEGYIDADPEPKTQQRREIISAELEEQFRQAVEEEPEKHPNKPKKPIKPKKPNGNCRVITESDLLEGLFEENETNPDRAELKQKFAAAKICLAATEDVLRKAREIGDEEGANEAMESVKKAKKRFDKIKAKAKDYAEYRTPEEIARAITNPIMRDIFNDRMVKTEEDYLRICLEEDVLPIFKYIVKANRKK